MIVTTYSLPTGDVHDIGTLNLQHFIVTMYTVNNIMMLRSLSRPVCLRPHTHWTYFNRYIIFYLLDLLTFYVIYNRVNHIEINEMYIITL